MAIKSILIPLLLISGPAFAADALSLSEQHRLGSYLAYIVAGVNDSTPQPDTYTEGQTCDACGGRGSVGDGVIESPCDFVTPDGTLACRGTGKLKKTGSAPQACFSCMEIVEDDLEGLWDKARDRNSFDPVLDVIKDEIADLGPSEAAELCGKLQEVLEDQAENPTEPDILCFKGSAWTFENKRVRQATNQDMVDHLVEVHGLDRKSASKMSREELIATHNLLHNSEVRSSAPSSSCPSGQCPSTKSGSSGSSCPSGQCPSSGSGSSSRSRGLFGRRR